MSRAARVAALQLFFSAVAFAAHTAQRKVSFAASSSFGARAGRWLANVPWFGFAIDVSSVRASGSDLNIGAIPISLLLMFRWPNAESEPILKLPIQLHAAVGPTLVIVPDLRIDLRPAVAEKVESPSGGWGVDFRSGLAWNFSSRVALFAEYRYIRYHVGFKGKACLTPGCVLVNFIMPFPGASDGTRREADATVESHQFVAGTSFRF